MTKAATQIVHWPGQDTPACDEHALKLKGLACYMGFQVSCTPIPKVECCAEHIVPLIHGRCPECKDKNGNSFVLDMQSKILIEFETTCKNCENEEKKQ